MMSARSIDTPGRGEGGLRMAVFVDSDGIGRKYGGQRLDWSGISTFPFSPSEVAACSRFLVNTRSKSGSRWRSAQLGYERAASDWGFRVYHRPEKGGESSKGTAFKQGSRAILGTLIGLYSNSVDVVVIHDCSSQAAEIVDLTLRNNPALKVVVVARRPSNRTVEVSHGHDGRVRILDPDDHPQIHLSDSTGGTSLEIPEVALDKTRIRRSSATLVDGPNYLGWGKTVSDKADALFDSSKLATGESIIVVSERKGGSRNRDAVLDRHWRDPWDIVRVEVEGRRAKDDGVIGALMGQLASRHSTLSLFSSDSDFIECQRIIKEEMGTELYTICPPVTRFPTNHPVFMGTKPEVITNENSTWICAFTGLPDNHYSVPEFDYPREIALGFLFNGTRAQKRDVRRRRREFRAEYLNRLRDKLARVKVQVPADSEDEILAPARSQG